MRIVVLALVVVGLTACARGDGTAGAGDDETPAQFAMRITTLLRDGNFAAAWIDLHPEHQKLVTRSTLADCWTQTDDVLNNPDVELEVTAVADEPWAIPGTSMTSPSKAITVEASVPAEAGDRRVVLETWTQHAFDVEGEGWTWILAPALLADARTNVC